MECQRDRVSARLMTLCGTLLLAAFVTAQSPDGALPRRPWLGVALGPHERGALVTAVVEGSSASAAGLRAGDVISAVNGAPMRAPGDVIAAVLQHRDSTALPVEIIREQQAQQHSIVLRPFPQETLPGVTFEYGSVTVDEGSRLRTVVSVPNGAGRRLPAVMLIQGGGCGSIDLPLTPDVGTTGVLRTIAARGYVTMRVEKSGVGDSRGPACDEIGYTQELNGYRAAFAALKRHSSVDPEQVFLLGISLGGVFAPTLANESPVRGVVVFGSPPGPPSPYPGRSERFFREFASADIEGAWSAISARVLVLYGEFDEPAMTFDRQRIAAMVNARHPGAATHVELAGLDHCWTFHASIEKSRGNCGRGEETSTMSDAVLAFLR
jgi:dienelactone hydrolase